TLLSRASPRRDRGHRGAVCPARRRSDKLTHAFLEEDARTRSCDSSDLWGLRQFRKFHNGFEAQPAKQFTFLGRYRLFGQPRRQPIGLISDFLAEREQCTTIRLHS